MWKLNWPAASDNMPLARRRVWHGLLVAGLLAFMLVLNGCVSDEPGTGPLADLGITNSPTPTPTSTPVPTSTPTPTPTATPTPLPALPGAQWPAGQLFFSVAREGEAGQSLWWLPAGGALTLVADAVAPDAWDCWGGATTRCVLVTTSGAVVALAPDGSNQALLDEITWGAGQALAAAAAQAEAAPLSTPALPISATLPMSATLPISATLPSLRVQAAPDGAQVAVAMPDRVQLFGLDGSQLIATALLTDTARLIWSPDSAILALVTQEPDSQTLVLWQPAPEQLRNLASVTQIGDLAWSAQSDKLAFDAQHGRGLRDVFFLDRATGEVRSLSEFALRDPKRAASGQVAAWRPAWEEGAKALRYVRGNPSDPQSQSVVRHPLDSGQFSALWPVAEEGLLGLLTTPDGQFQARLIERDGWQVLQLRPTAGGDWQDITASVFEDVQGLAWDPPAADGSHRYLLATRPQAVLWIDTWTGEDGDAAVACEQCRVERAVWRP